ncbi:hypothetical protein BDZ94DRAFT_1307379 [Collybia nuda]|uniref:PH domain-containing protein n=1 Tax=Collybia nuda TaxID=64659 RepID=A0A9P5YA45_9AGAR|nr:hypothetical protein BDZ94DRAFT_1307379 [Collybia nuda]
MPGPRSVNPSFHNASSLQQRSSTKHLIGRFESMNNSPLQSPNFTRVYSGKPLAVPLQHAPPASRKKEKSPIRRSFRNLFLVLKKATTGSKNDIQGDFISTLPVLSTVKSSPPSGHINRIFSGFLLYLLRPPCLSETSVSPCWIPCTATLEDGRIIIAPTSTQGFFVTHTIYLSHCADVRSLTVQQLDPNENVLLQQRKDINDLRVFEILFEGKAREKFATTSIRDRAGWVSAIWDAILPCHQPNNANHEICKISPPPEITVDVQPPLENLALSQIYTERLLPPIPPDSSHHRANPTLVALRDQSRTMSSVSTSVYPLSRSASPTSCKKNNSRSTSPSILNLERLSVVQQRLAQIESIAPHRAPSSKPKSPTSLSCDSRSTHLTNPSMPLGRATNLCDALRWKQLKRTESVKSNLTNASHSDTRLAPPDMTVPKEPDYMSSQQSSSRFADNGIESRLEPFAELLRDHAAKNYDQTANLGTQIISLQNEVQRLPQELACVVSDGSSDTDIHKIISSLEVKTGVNGETLKAINSKLNTIGVNALALDDTAEIRQIMQNIRQILNEDISIISKKLDVVQQNQEQHALRASTALNNLGSAPNRVLPGSDILELQEKVDMLINICRPKFVAEREGRRLPLNASIPEASLLTLAEIRTLFEENKSQGVLQSRQQAETVRYLNELNTWLETFVNNGTSQIYNMSLNIERLSQYLGCGPQRLEDTANESSCFLAGISRSLHDIQIKDLGLAALQTSLDEIIAYMNESPKSLNMTAVASLIDRQRQDQEGLFKALTSKISDEIRGERLRFVEAMKEATAINVQIHVEQFKAELSREVSGMTEQVGRLHRERQAMETQIADLFAFYTKQKEAVGPVGVLMVFQRAYH